MRLAVAEAASGVVVDRCSGAVGGMEPSDITRGFCNRYFCCCCCCDDAEMGAHAGVEGVAMAVVAVVVDSGASVDGGRLPEVSPAAAVVVGEYSYVPVGE